MNWLIFLLTGIILGFIGGVIIDRDTVNKYYNKFRKVKVKNGSTANITIDQLKGELKEKRREMRRSKRLERKANS